MPQAPEPEPPCSRSQLKSSDSSEGALPLLLARSAQFVATHRRGMTAAVMLSLAGFGVTAFGIAPLAPDASDLPKRLVTEAVKPDAIKPQLIALAEKPIQLYRTDLTRFSDTADSLFKRLNVSDVAAAQFLRTDPTSQTLFDGPGGKRVRAQADEYGVLNELVARFEPADPALLGSHFTRLTIRRHGDSFKSTFETVPLTAHTRIGSGTVRTSLFAATDEAGIPDNVAQQMADVFSNDVDFHSHLRKGDTFSVVYESLTADGEPITWGPSSAGRLLAADFDNDGHTYSAVWFQGKGRKGAYYNFDGQSKQRTFLASPMEFSRITSGFSMRMHPILNIWKQHKGVDYGAPTGTAVHAVGEGTIDFAGWQNGYGNVVEIRHSPERSTLYAHLSKINVKLGGHVDQGQRIGAVGMTGWATGPHLHFEVKVDGMQKDPVLMARASEAVPLAPAQKIQFTSLADSYRQQLDAADSVARSDNYGE